MSEYTFPREWFDALAKHRSSTVAHIMRHWFAVLSVGPVRVPHIETIDTSSSVRFTWNRDHHYLEFEVFRDGRVEWFYNSPDNIHTGTEESATADLPPEFFEHVRKYATP